MSKKVKIGNIEIEIGGRVMKLKLEEAKELRDMLNSTFPEKEYIPSTPIIIDRDYYPWRRDYWACNIAPFYGNSITATNGDSTLRLSYTGAEDNNSLT